MKKRTAELLEMLENAGNSPLSHDDWVDAWQTLYDDHKNSPDATSEFSAIDQAALGSMLNKNQSYLDVQLGHELCRKLDRFKHPAFLVTSDGRITAFNQIASKVYEIDIGDKVNSLPVSLVPAEPLEKAIQSLLTSEEADGAAVFRQAYSSSSANNVTLAITPSSAHKSAALVFLISTRWEEGATSFIKRQFGLTKAECHVLIAFVEGHTLKEISASRGRSHATIRTQFQSLMEKMGVNNQAALLRTALSLSDFSTQFKTISTVLEHPHRKSSTIMQIGGRLVEATFCGDPYGKPLLHIPTIAIYCFNSTIERLLFEAGLYVITVCMPGYGKTDLPPEGVERLDQYTTDTVAILDLLSIPHCPVMTMNAGTPIAFHLADSVPERITHIALLSACPPLKYWSRYGTGASWFDAVLRVSEKYQAMRSILITAGLKAFCAIGSRQFHRLQVAGNQADVELLMKPENVAEIESALKNATTHGLSVVLADVLLLFQSNTTTPSRRRLNVSIIHGTEDPIFPIESMRDLAVDNPKSISLIEIEGAGYTLLQSQTETVVELLTNIAALPLMSDSVDKLRAV